nr:MAG TPA: hypothetical protein [Bacteriophage sp.]
MVNLSKILLLLNVIIMLLILLIGLRLRNLQFGLLIAYC